MKGKPEQVAFAEKFVSVSTDASQRTRYKRGMTKTQSRLPSQSIAFKNMIREMWRQYEAARETALRSTAQTSATTDGKLVASS